VAELDLADLDSVREFAEGFESAYDGLDVLVNNAGVMAIPRRETADGFETQFGVNHLGHFALTGLLLDSLRAGATEGERDRRIVTVSSGAHQIGKIDFSDLQSERSYDKWRAYGQSKLANLLFAYELDRRLRADGSRVKSVAAHPGWAATELQSTGPEMAGSKLRGRLMAAGNELFAQSAEMGARPALYAATSPDATGGDYIGPGGFAEMRGAPVHVASNERSHDRKTARRLWDESEELTGVEFDLPEPTATIA
jgi:NAD(P)-dependent dehydrogenase (short-subunit alcohol dehydrogenase family)